MSLKIYKDRLVCELLFSRLSLKMFSAKVVDYEK